MTTRQKRSKVDTTTMTIQTPTAVISQSTSERLLGAQIHQDMRWKEHLLDGKDALIKSLNKRQGAIKKLIKVASFKTLKSVADGIFMSKLTYLMPVWAGCEEYMVNSLQIVQNKVARTMTKQSRFTSTRKLMEDCQWLSTRQLMFYHSVLQLHKTLKNQAPVYLFQKATEGREYHYRTRQATGGVLRQGPKAGLDLSRRGWCCRSVEDYNKLPHSLRLDMKLPSFKKKLKEWTKKNINI